MPTLRWAVMGCLTLFVALSSAQAQDFGMYPMVQVPRGEISASAYFLNHAPSECLADTHSSEFSLSLER